MSQIVDLPCRNIKTDEECKTRDDARGFSSQDSEEESDVSKADPEFTVGAGAGRRTASVVLCRRRQVLLRRYFAALRDLAARSSERRLERADGFVRSRSDRHRREILRRWWDFVRRGTASERRVERRARLRRLRCSFSVWWKVATDERDAARAIMEERNHRTKARALRQWRRSVRALRSEREAARDAIRRAEEARLDATAREFYRGNTLTVCLVGWRVAARSGRDRRAMEEGRRRRRTKVEGLFDRIGEVVTLPREEKEVYDSSDLPSPTRKSRPNRQSHAEGKKKSGLLKSSVRSAFAGDEDKENCMPNTSRRRRPDGATATSKRKAPGHRIRSRIGAESKPRRSPPFQSPSSRTDSTEKPYRRTSAPSPPLASPASAASSLSTFPRPNSRSSPSSRLALEMDRRWEERRRVRQAMADKRTQQRLEQKEAEEEARRRAEDEEQRLLKEERKRRDDEERARIEETERRREGWRFAGLHYQFGLMMRGWKFWREAMTAVSLRQQKAHIFWRDSVTKRYLDMWQVFVHECRQHKQQLELEQLKLAEIRYHHSLQHKVLSSWNSHILRIRYELYDEACLLRARRTAARVFARWAHAHIDEIDRATEKEVVAKEFRWFWTKRRALREWRKRSEECKMDREVEERVEKKWRKVKSWLGNEHG